MVKRYGEKGALAGSVVSGVAAQDILILLFFLKKERKRKKHKKGK